VVAVDEGTEDELALALQRLPEPVDAPRPVAIWIEPVRAQDRPSDATKRRNTRLVVVARSAIAATT
jgi:hypothetical protein